MSLSAMESIPPLPLSCILGKPSGPVYHIIDGKDGKVHEAHSYTSAFLFLKLLEERDRIDNITCVVKWAEYNKQRFPSGRAMYRRYTQWWVVILPGGPFQIKCVTGQITAEQVTNIYNDIIETSIRPTIDQYYMLRQVIVMPYEYNHIINEVSTVDYLFEPPSSSSPSPLSQES